MRVIGYPTSWKESEGLVPLELQDLQLSAKPAELRALATYLLESAAALEQGDLALGQLELPDSKPNPATGICFQVVGHAAAR